MKLNLIGPFVVNAPFGSEIAFAKGLRKIGVEVNEVDPNVDREMVGLHNDADATMVFKSCVGAERFLKSLKHPVIVYQPDDARFPHIRQMMVEMREYADLFLSFDDNGAKVAKTMGYRAAETLVLTADPDLYVPDSSIVRDIDVSFIGSLSGPVSHASRRKMCQIVDAVAKQMGWVTCFGEAYFDGRAGATPVQIYQRSKVVINHATDVGQQFGTGFGLQCRHFEVGMTKTAFLSNHLIGPPGEQVGRRTSKCLDLPNDHTLAWECPMFQTFNSPESLLFQLERMLSESWQRDAEILYSQIQAAHLPEHRAEQLVGFVKRYS